MSPDDISAEDPRDDVKDSRIDSRTRSHLMIRWDEEEMREGDGWKRGEKKFLRRPEKGREQKMGERLTAAK
jgi:hypothetical protein